MGLVLHRAVRLRTGVCTEANTTSDDRNPAVDARDDAASNDGRGLV